MADSPGSPGGRRHALSRIAAGIVVFRPDPDQVARLAALLLGDADRLIVFLNSPVPDDLRRTWSADSRITLIAATENLGIGVGLNLIALDAFLRQDDAIAFFDQDSTPPSGLLRRLATAWSDLDEAGRRPCVVSPMLTVPAAQPGKAPRYRFLAGREHDAVRAVAFVPTSGSLIPVSVLRDTGLFRADFFIDGIDLEWCFRAQARAYGCFVDTACQMEHTVGRGTVGSARLGWQMPLQRPFRMYCLVRNTLYGFRLGHVPLGWKLRQLAYLPLQIVAFALHHRLNASVLRLLLLGAYDGLVGRLGPPRGLPP